MSALELGWAPGQQVSSLVSTIGVQCCEYLGVGHLLLGPKEGLRIRGPLPAVHGPEGAGIRDREHHAPSKVRKNLLF